MRKKTSSEFFEIPNEEKEKEKNFDKFFKNFSKNFSNIKENINYKIGNDIKNYETSNNMNINFSEFKSFLNNNI